jgi:tRNA(fMet)-specific endonuclease VapC
MKALLDTNTCVYVLKRNQPAVVQRFASYETGELAVSTITVAELAFGAEKSARPEQNLNAIEHLLLGLTVVEFDYLAAREYGQIRAWLQRHGTPIGPLDMQLAAHARQLNLPLVTNNVKEFSRVPRLRTENWVTG